MRRIRDTIASGIGSLLAVIASHVRRPITSRTDAPHHFVTRVWTGAVTDSGEDRNFYRAVWNRACAELGIKGLTFHAARHTGDRRLARRHAGSDVTPLLARDRRTA